LEAPSCPDKAVRRQIRPHASDIATAGFQQTMRSTFEHSLYSLIPRHYSSSFLAIKAALSSRDDGVHPCQFDLLKRLIQSKPTLEGAGVHLRRAFGFGNTKDFDPFLLLDDFRNDVPEDYLAGPLAVASSIKRCRILNPKGICIAV
jgi:hypothetical protein